MTTEEYLCLDCRHVFPSHKQAAEETCPRCGSCKLFRNPWLLGTSQAEGLTPDDYRERVEVTT